MTIDVYKEWLGIPDGPRPPDHYELLRCVRFEDDIDKIRNFQRKLSAHVRKYATGKYMQESQDLLNELAKAMLCLTDPVRKRDYDEGLGREFEADLDEFGRMPLLDVLVDQGHVSREQKREIEAFAKARGLSERDAAVQMKLVPADVATQALARQLGFSYVDLDDMTPEDDVLDLVPRQLVRKHMFVPLFVDDDQLLVASIDQPEHELEEELRLRYGVPIRPVIATPRSIKQAIAKYYAQGERDEAKSTATPTRKATSGESSKATKGKPAKGPKRAFDQLPEAEQKHRKQIGLLLLCWSIILPMLPALLAAVSPRFQMIKAEFPAVGYIPWLVILTAPSTIYWVTQKYWK